jgi:hypothetical protein
MDIYLLNTVAEVAGRYMLTADIVQDQQTGEPWIVVK